MLPENAPGELQILSGETTAFDEVQLVERIALDTAL
jgi:hypothetical protein